MKQIPLSQGKVALVDDEDFEKVNKYRWRFGCKDYAVRGSGTSAKGNYRTHYMHRVILNAPENLQIDHKNRNKLDNRKDNLRLATNAQNQTNSLRKLCFKTSRFKGVSWSKQKHKWEVRLSVDGKRIYAGRYTDEHEAARVYSALARHHYKEFALPNKV